jgi:methylenetetrahydrofolate dehydrogenase (NADP+)/methenyltetrahydrofolate cyclohydrolase
MSAIVMEGKFVADAVMKDVRARIAILKQNGIVPGLGTILVGNNPASVGYVRKKHEACEAVEMLSFDLFVPSDGSQEELLTAVREFNQNEDVDAFLVQNPVPSQFNFNESILKMNPNKDADGLHPMNLGRLVLQEPGPRPCTPAGIIAMLEYYNVPVEGKEVVIVGRGPTLGRPLALMLSLKQRGANAAVTVVHTGVPNISEYTRRADILIAAVGIANFITPEMVKPGAAVISGGISWEGRKLLPDVDESVSEVAGWKTARLGGVGPTTVALLLRNTVECA